MPKPKSFSKGFFSLPLVFIFMFLSTFYFMTVPAGEYLLASVAENFEKKVLEGRVKLEIPLGATEVGLISIVDEVQRQGRVKTGECGRLFPGLEMKVGRISSFSFHPFVPLSLSLSQCVWLHRY